MVTTPGDQVAALIQRFSKLNEAANRRYALYEQLLSAVLGHPSSSVDQPSASSYEPYTDEPRAEDQPVSMVTSPWQLSSCPLPPSCRRHAQLPAEPAVGELSSTHGVDVAPTVQLLTASARLPQP